MRANRIAALPRSDAPHLAYQGKCDCISTLTAAVSVATLPGSDFDRHHADWLVTANQSRYAICSGQSKMTQHTSIRNDFERLRESSKERRSPDRLLAHFEIEKRLSRRLRNSTRHERTALYSALYSELFSSLPDHPQNLPNLSIRNARLDQQIRFLSHQLNSTSVYLEIGCGDAQLTKLLAPKIRSAIGLDVTDKLIDPTDQIPNFAFLRSNGTNINLESGTVDLVYSNQLIEHLHPDDIDSHFANIVRVLKTGGRYVCTTPSSITGPHDISKYFGFEPLGFHLKEYNYTMLNRIFRVSGFRYIKPIIFIKGRALIIPLIVMTAMETILSMLPRSVRARAANNRLLILFAGVTVIGVK